MAKPVTAEDLSDTVIYTWADLAPGDAGEPRATVRTGDRVAQAHGVFGGAEVFIEGSLDRVNWFTLCNHYGEPVTFTYPSGSAILESPPFIRTHVLGGDETTSVTVMVSIRKS